MFMNSIVRKPSFIIVRRKKGTLDRRMRPKKERIEPKQSLHYEYALISKLCVIVKNDGTGVHILGPCYGFAGLICHVNYCTICTIKK